MNYKIKQLPSFPQNLIVFREYDGAKTLMLFLFILALIYFLTGFIPTPEQHGFFGFIGHFIKPITSKIFFLYRLFLLIFTYCLVWFTFDPKNFKFYVTPIVSIGLGALYVLSPIDIIPDFLVFGQVDDTLIGIGSAFFGLNNLWIENTYKSKLKLVVDFLNDGEEQKAVKLLLESNGFIVEENNN